jgi:Zn-dependent protease with chaperone function
LPACRGCACSGGLSRRLFAFGLLGAGTAIALPGWARDGVSVGEQSRLSKLVPAGQIEQAAVQQYGQLLTQARSQRALAPETHPQLVRLRAVAQRLIPFAQAWNPRAREWRWEVNLLGSNQVNAFCMPGGKIAFFFGILDRLKLNDDEVAMIMGHEMAHALREHARERVAKSTATNIGANVLSSLLGLGGLGNAVLGASSQLLSLTWSRDDETEADTVGLDLAARAGYDPRAGVTLWPKMGNASKSGGQSAPPQWLSTHPSGPSRIREIEANLPRVLPLYERADKPKQRFGPPQAQAKAD